VLPVKSFEKVGALRQFGESDLKQTFQLLDQPLLCTTTLATVTDSDLERSHWSLHRCWREVGGEQTSTV